MQRPSLVELLAGVLPSRVEGSGWDPAESSGSLSEMLVWRIACGALARSEEGPNRCQVLSYPC